MHNVYNIEELNSMTVHDLRIILSKLGGTPGQKKHAKMVEEIISIQLGKLTPVRSPRGRKPKYNESERILNANSSNEVENGGNGDDLNENLGLQNKNGVFLDGKFYEIPDKSEQKNIKSLTEPICVSDDIIFPPKKKVDFPDYLNGVHGPFCVELSDVTADVEYHFVGHGILDISNQGDGFLRNIDYGSKSADFYVDKQIIDEHNLKTGDYVIGFAKNVAPKGNYSIYEVKQINGYDSQTSLYRGNSFESFTAEYASQKIKLESENCDISVRFIDALCPFAKGQRAIVRANRMTGCTTLLKNIALAISKNLKDTFLSVLLVDDRPEDVSGFAKDLPNGSVVATTFEDIPEKQIKYVELYFERAKRMAEIGKDSVIILDSLTKLAKAYDKVMPLGSRTLPCGLNYNTVAIIKKYLATARKLDNGGSITVVATAICDDNDNYEKALLNELRGSENLNLILSSELFKARVFPSIDVLNSFAKSEQLIFSNIEFAYNCKIRDFIAKKGVNGYKIFIEMLKQTKTNQELYNKFDEWVLAIEC